MKTLTRVAFPISFFLLLALMLCGFYPSPVIAAVQSRPDLVLRIHGLVPALKVVDDIAGAAGSRVSPSGLISGMLQRTGWIDSSKDIVFGAWFDPAHPDAPPVMGALVPFVSENTGFASAYHAVAKGSHYLISLPPGNPKPLSQALESALVKESRATSGRFLSMEISLSQILKDSDALVEKWSKNFKIKRGAFGAGSGESISPDQAKKIISGFVDFGKQVKRLAVGIGLNRTEVSFFMSIKGTKGSRLNRLLTKKGAPEKSRLVNLALPGNYPIRFSMHPFSHKDIIDFLNDSLGKFYKSMGIDLAATGKIMGYFTGETAGGLALKKGKGLEIAVVAVLNGKVASKPDFLKTIYIPWLIDYGKNMPGISMGAHPVARFLPHFVWEGESKVSGYRVWGVKGWFPVMPVTGKKTEKISVSIRMTVVDGLLLAASDDSRLGGLISAVAGLKPGVATGPLFKVRISARSLIKSETGGNSGTSMSGGLILTADIKDGALVFEEKMSVADIKALVASAMKRPKPQTPSVRERLRPQTGQKSLVTKKRKLAPDTPGYWINKGSLCSAYGDNIAAVRSFKKALKLDPKAVEAEFKLGVSYGVMREYDKALKYMNAALSVSPENSRYRYGRAWIYLLSGQKDKAMADMKAAAKMGNPDAIGYLERPH